MDQNSMMGGVPPMQNQNNSMNGANFGGQQQPMGSGMPPMGAVMGSENFAVQDNSAFVAASDDMPF